MRSLLNVIQIAAYTGGSAYMGYLIGNNQCPGSTFNFYAAIYGPALADACAGALSGMRGNAYHGNIISRLTYEQPEGDAWEIMSIGEGVKGTAVGATAGLSVSGLAHYLGILAGDLASRLF